MATEEIDNRDDKKRQGAAHKPAVGAYKTMRAFFRPTIDHIFHIRLAKGINSDGQTEKLPSNLKDIVNHSGEPLAFITVSKTNPNSGDLRFAEFCLIANHAGEFIFEPFESTHMRKKSVKKIHGTNEHGVDVDTATPTKKTLLVETVVPVHDRLMREDGKLITPKSRMKNGEVDEARELLNSYQDHVLDAFSHMLEGKKPILDQNGFGVRSFDKKKPKPSMALKSLKDLAGIKIGDEERAIGDESAARIYVDTNAPRIDRSPDKTNVIDRLYIADPNNPKKELEIPHLKICADARLVDKSSIPPHQKQLLSKLSSGKFEIWVMPKEVRPADKMFFIIKRNKKGTIQSATRYLIHEDKEGHVSATPLYYMTDNIDNAVSHPSHNMIVRGENDLEKANTFANLVAKDVQKHWNDYYDMRDLPDNELAERHKKNRTSSIPARFTVAQYIESERLGNGTSNSQKWGDRVDESRNKPSKGIVSS